MFARTVHSKPLANKRQQIQRINNYNVYWVSSRITTVQPGEELMKE